MDDIKDSDPASLNEKAPNEARLPAPDRNSESMKEVGPESEVRGGPEAADA